MTNWAQRERQALADLLEAVGPEAPTLCGGWTTRDLAAHLVIRERRPDALVGIVTSFGPFGAWTEKVQAAAADQDWATLVDRVRGGPPIWSPLRLNPLDAMANTVEFFVHHEDVRRAGTDWTPRTLPDDHEAALWSALGRMKMLVRSSPAGLTWARPDGTTRVAKSATPMVTVTGPPGELLLFAFGRGAQAAVTVTGPDDAVDAVRAAQFGV